MYSNISPVTIYPPDLRKHGIRDCAKMSISYVFFLTSVNHNNYSSQLTGTFT